MIVFILIYLQKDHTWKDNWNEVKAKKFCEEYLYKNYTVGQLCTLFPNVDIQQEIKTCMEDIQVNFHCF